MRGRIPLDPLIVPLSPLLTRLDRHSGVPGQMSKGYPGIWKRAAYGVPYFALQCAARFCRFTWIRLDPLIIPLSPLLTRLDRHSGVPGQMSKGYPGIWKRAAYGVSYFALQCAARFWWYSVYRFNHHVTCAYSRNTLSGLGLGRPIN